MFKNECYRLKEEYSAAGQKLEKITDIVNVLATLVVTGWLSKTMLLEIGKFGQVLPVTGIPKQVTKLQQQADFTTTLLSWPDPMLCCSSSIMPSRSVSPFRLLQLESQFLRSSILCLRKMGIAGIDCLIQMPRLWRRMDFYLPTKR